MQLVSLDPLGHLVPQDEQVPQAVQVQQDHVGSLGPLDLVVNRDSEVLQDPQVN